MSNSNAVTQNNNSVNSKASNEQGQQLAAVWFAPFLPYLYAFLVGVLSGLAVNGISEATKNALGSGELTNAMSDKAKESLVNDAKLMNRLVDLANEAEASGNAANAKIYRNAISNLYSDMANTIDNDLRNIQQNNPKMVAHARELVSGLRTSAVEVTKPGASLSKFNPQSIRAQIESGKDIASVAQEKPENRSNYQQIASALKENHAEIKKMGFDVNNVVGLEAAMNIYAEVNNIDAASLFSQSPYRKSLADSIGQSAVDNHNSAVEGLSLSTKENAQQKNQVSAQSQLA